MQAVNPMRLLFVCNEYPPAVHGGIGSFVFSLTKQLLLNGREVHVIGFDPSVVRSITREEQGVCVTRLCSPFRDSRYLRWGRYDIAVQTLDRIYLSQQVRRYCQQHRIDVVESHDWSGPLWFHPGRPLVVRMHGAHLAHAFYEKRRTPRFIAYVEQRNLRMADTLVAVSQHIGQLTLRAARIAGRAFEVIYNGVDTSVFHRIDSVKRSDNEVLFAGTVARRKGIYELFDAIPFVLDAAPSARFTILGRLPEDKSSRASLEEALLSKIHSGQRQSISFTDVRPHGEMPYWYNRATCAVFPSLAEAYGLTCTEAMSCGAPVVMTSRASGPEIVEDGVSGLLRDPADSIALAEAVVSLLAKKALRDTISRNAVEQIGKRFEIRKNLKANLTVYESMVIHGTH
jgi:glycosyltransferase involved in cell wall biosynthesis